MLPSDPLTLNPVTSLLATATDGGPLPGFDATGVVVIVDHLRSGVAAILLLWVATALGGRILARVPARGESTTEAFVFGALVGCGVLATLNLGAAATGVLYPWVPPALLIVAGVWARREAGALPARLAGLIRGGWASLRGAGLGPPLAAVGGVVFFFALPRLVLPPADWDSLMYHLPVPLALLEAGELVIPPDNLHLAWSGLFHLLSVTLVGWTSPASVQVLNGLLFLLLVGAVAAGASRMAGCAAAGAAAAVALIGSTMVLLVGVTARVDTTLALWLWAGHLAVLVLVTEGWDRGWALRATLILGFALGVKYHTLGYGLMLTPLILLAVFRGAPDPIRALRRLGAMAAGVGLLSAPWFLKNAFLFGSPLYPFGGGRVVPPWLADILGSDLHPAEVGHDIYWVLREARAPFNPVTFLTEPGRTSVEAEAAFFLLSPLLLLLVLPLARRDRRVGAALLLLPALGFLLFILALSVRTNPRYLIPVLPPMAVAAGVGFALLRERISPALAPRLGGAILVVGAVTLLSILPAAPGPGVAWRHAFGLTSARSTLEARGLRDLLALGDSLRTMGPSGTLLIAEARGLYLPPGTLQDNVLTNWPLLTASAAPERCLAGTGIGAVVVGRGSLGYYAGRGMSLDPLRLDAFSAFAERCLDPLPAPGGYERYRVRGVPR
ncbi:MAG: hypothetical protein RQ745_06515 [Longimicrobiales bacterium]|nr:hypothetical protein [Longimicrobiales bacterium]